MGFQLPGGPIPGDPTHPLNNSSLPGHFIWYAQGTDEKSAEGMSYVPGSLTPKLPEGFVYTHALNIAHNVPIIKMERAGEITPAEVEAILNAVRLKLGKAAFALSFPGSVPGKEVLYSDQ